MKGIKEKQDLHFPLWSNDNVFRRLFWPPRRLTKPYVREGQTAADLGCGPGFFTLALADCVGPEGKVYAVDSDEKAVRALEAKTAKSSHRNIEARARSASDLSFIGDGSVDFILAHGLLCAMAPKDHEAALSEMKRILKPDGLAYLSAAKGPPGHVDRAEWERILDGFEVKRRGDGFPVFDNRWAVVSLKKR